MVRSLVRAGLVVWLELMVILVVVVAISSTAVFAVSVAAVLVMSTLAVAVFVSMTVASTTDIVLVSVAVVRLTVILRVLVVLSLVVRLVVVILSLEVTVLFLVVRLLVVSVMVDVLADWLVMFRSDLRALKGIEVHLRVGILRLEMMIDLPSLVVLRHNLNAMTMSVDWLMVLAVGVMSIVDGLVMSIAMLVSSVVWCIDVGNMGLNWMDRNDFLVASIVRGLSVVVRVMGVSVINGVRVMSVSVISMVPSDAVVHWLIVMFGVGPMLDWMVLRVALVVTVHFPVVVVLAFIGLSVVRFVVRLPVSTVLILVVSMTGRCNGSNSGKCERSHLVDLCLIS